MERVPVGLTLAATSTLFLVLFTTYYKLVKSQFQEEFAEYTEYLVNNYNTQLREPDVLVAFVFGYDAFHSY